MNHRGRFQAQGRALEESEAWAQLKPILLSEGIGLLNALEAKIPLRDRINRRQAFRECKQCIENASKNNGIRVDDMGKPFIKSFPKNYKERVDLEVRKGVAFILKHSDDDK